MFGNANLGNTAFSVLDILFSMETKAKGKHEF